MMATALWPCTPTMSATSTWLGNTVDLPLCDRKSRSLPTTLLTRTSDRGCVKITGAHDFNDYACAQRNNLPSDHHLHFTPRINENGPPAYQGLDRFEARASGPEGPAKPKVCC
jgi:valyl-tRNA synthetase